MPWIKSRRTGRLRDPNVVRWYGMLRQEGAKVTADVYLRRFGAFCEQMKVKPQALLKLGDRELRDLLTDFIGKEQAKGRAGSYIHSSVKAVKSFLAHNDRHLVGRVRIRDADQTPTLVNERTPTQEELNRVLRLATPRDRVVCVLMAHCGFRPEVLGNYDGTEGLRLADFPELTVDGGEFAFRSVPSLVRVRPELSKTRKTYLTFVTAEACEYIQAYLQDRARAGEKLAAASDLVHPIRAKKAFLTAINVGDAVRTALRGAGFSWRPYVLRAYFDTQLLLAESKGKVPQDYRVFWMGHRGSMDARYTTNKGRLPETVIEDMRAAYGRCQEFLSTVPTKDNLAHRRQEVVFELFRRKFGISEDEFTKLLSGEITIEQVSGEGDSGASRVATGPKREPVPTEAPRLPPERRVFVGHAEIKRALVAGWDIIKDYGESAVLQRSAAN